MGTAGGSPPAGGAPPPPGTAPPATPGGPGNPSPRRLRARPARSARSARESRSPPVLMPAFACYRAEVYSRPTALSTGTVVRPTLDGQVRVLVGDHGAKPLVYRLRNRDERERGLH